MTISSYARLDPVPVTDEGKVLELFGELCSDAEIHVIRQDVEDEVLLGFCAEDTFSYEGESDSLIQFLNEFRSYIKLGFATMYKEVNVKFENGQIDFDGFSWMVSRDSLKSFRLDNYPEDAKIRLEALMSEKNG